MKIMQVEVHNAHKHPWREAVRTQVPTIIVACFIVVAYLVGLWHGSHECDCGVTYSVSRDKQ